MSEDKNIIHPKQIYGTFKIPVCALLEKIRHYGIYKRNGKEWIRDYGRNLKNNKGLNIYDVMKWRLDTEKKRLNRLFWQIGNT